jgi:hypothetical protein
MPGSWVWMKVASCAIVFWPPFGGLEAIADVSADQPVKLIQLLIGGGNGAVLRSLDQRQNFGELGLEVICHCFARTMLKPILTTA